MFKISLHMLDFSSFAHTIYRNLCMLIEYAQDLGIPQFYTPRRVVLTFATPIRQLGQSYWLKLTGPAND